MASALRGRHLTRQQTGFHTRTRPTSTRPRQLPHPHRLYITTTTTGPAQNANANVVTASVVTKTPVPVPLRTFRTVLLTTRSCELRLELDAREGVKVECEVAEQGEGT